VWLENVARAGLAFLSLRLFVRPSTASDGAKMELKFRWSYTRPDRSLLSTRAGEDVNRTEARLVCCCQVVDAIVAMLGPAPIAQVGDEKARRERLWENDVGRGCAAAAAAACWGWGSAGQGKWRRFT
jgi:hypothetical protein